MKRYLAALLALMAAFACACGERQGNAPVETPAQKAEQTPAPTPSDTPPAPTLMPTLAPVGEAALLMSTCVIECEDTVNIRSEASSRSTLLGTLAAGTRVRVIEFEERYAYIEVPESGERGYVVAGYLKPESDGYGLDIVKITERYTHEQMQADIAAIKAAYGDMTEVRVAGESGRGAEIPVLVLGDADAPHQVFVQAAVHGREHMTTLLVMALSETWLRDGGSEDVCFHVMPMANPDGVKISQDAQYDDHTRQMYVNDYAAGRTDTEGEEYLLEWKANYRGVDINRNFDALWENVDTAPAPASEGYRGETPESEPETQALVNYTKEHEFDLTISYHATGSLIYWQFGPASPADEAAHALANIIGEIAGYTVEFDDGTSFGGYKDWASSKLSIPSITIEIGTRAAPLPETDFYNVWARNRLVFKTVAEWVKNA